MSPQEQKKHISDHPANDLDTLIRAGVYRILYNVMTMERSVREALDAAAERLGADLPDETKRALILMTMDNKGSKYRKDHRRYTRRAAVSTRLSLQG